MLTTREPRPPLGPDEAVALERAAAGHDLPGDMAARLIGLDLVWRTSWGKLALSGEGVETLRALRRVE